MCAYAYLLPYLVGKGAKESRIPSQWFFKIEHTGNGLQLSQPFIASIALKSNRRS
jgi:hypothetical protein